MAGSSPSDHDAYTIIVDSTSPTIFFSPPVGAFTPANLSTEWSVALGGSLDQEYIPLATATDEASFSLTWNGTGISLYGDFLPGRSGPGFANAGTYSVSLDKTPTTNYAFSRPSSNTSSGVLASFTNLVYGEHSVELTLHNPGTIYDGSVLLRFDRAILSGAIPPIPSPRRPFSNSGLTPTSKAILDDMVSYQGQWSFEPNLLPGRNTAFHTSTNIGDRALVFFNGTAITVSGLLTPNGGSYNVSVDNEAPLTLSARSPFNGSIPTVLYYRTGLDPSVMHQLSVVNTGPLSDGSTGRFLALAAVVTEGVVSDSGPLVGEMPPKGLPRGTISAISACASLTLLGILFGLGIYIYRRRRAARRKRGFIQNPRVDRLRRFNIGRALSIRSNHGKVEEKGPQRSLRGSKRDAEDSVIDVSATKARSKGPDDTNDPQARLHRSDSIDSQSSDGSLAIDFPRLPGGTLTVQHRAIPLSPASLLSPVSPRASRPRGPREMHNSLLPHEGGRGILLIHSQGSMGNPEEHSPLKTHSPLRVNFEGETARQAESRRESRHATAGTMLRSPTASHPSPVPSTKSPLPPIPGNVEQQHSFLDMDSTTSPSIKSQSRSTTRSLTNSSSGSFKFRGGTSSSDPSVRSPANRTSFALSVNIGGDTDASMPSSPNISLQPVSPPPDSVRQPPLASLDTNTSAHTHDRCQVAAGLLPSPTDSIPLTISDIHFRHSPHSSLSLSGGFHLNGSHLPPHPPLPANATPKSPIVQKLLGIRASASPDTPSVNPTVPTSGAEDIDGATNDPPVPGPAPPGMPTPAHDNIGRAR